MNEDRTLLLPALGAFREATGSILYPIEPRTKAADQWIAHSIIHDADVPEVVDAHNARLDIQDLFIMFGGSLSEQRTRISSPTGDRKLEEVVSDAAAYALHRGQPMAAVELLDRGRAMMFAQLGRYRTSPEELAMSSDPNARALAERFILLGRQLTDIATSEPAGTNGNVTTRCVRSLLLKSKSTNHTIKAPRSWTRMD